MQALNTVLGPSAHAWSKPPKACRIVGLPSQWLQTPCCFIHEDRARYLGTLARQGNTYIQTYWWTNLLTQAVGIALVKWQFEKEATKMQCLDVQEFRWYKSVQQVITSP
jgi:hypothetical protein